MGQESLRAKAARAARMSETPASGEGPYIRLNNLHFTLTEAEQAALDARLADIQKMLETPPAP
jgi:hypothetical protein